MRSQRASSRCHTANGYPLREGPEAKPLSPIYGPLIDDTTLPVRISDTVVLDQRIKIQNSALAYKTGVEGLAIANGFVYRGKRWPQLRGAVVFGDITSGRLFYARMADLVAATDGNPATVAPYAEITTALPALVQERVNANAAPRGPATGLRVALPLRLRREQRRLRLHRPRRLDPRLGLRADVGPRLQVRRLPGPCGWNCASQQMRPERSTS